jgi:Ser/Thr protein kinase RdoA (MazF antagonist)
VHPASDYPLLWDIKQAAKLIPLLEHVPDKELQLQFQRRLENFVERVEPRLRHCRSQIIHNDLNWGNVLADGERNDRILGIIDFGDMLKSPLIIDIAVASAYLCKTGDQPLADVHEFLRGYHDVTPILPGEFELLPDLMLMRNVQTIVIAHWRASQYPENQEYLLCSVPDAKQTIVKLAERSSTDIAADLESVCTTPRKADA